MHLVFGEASHPKTRREAEATLEETGDLSPTKGGLTAREKRKLKAEVRDAAAARDHFIRANLRLYSKLRPRSMFSWRAGDPV